MLDHVSITVSDIAVAEPFYDAVMAAIGVAKIDSDHAATRIGYGERCDARHPDRTYLTVKADLKPDDAPRRHWCFKAPSRAAVDAFWQAGLVQGGRDNGAPGLRPEYHASYYAAFLFDPDGNRIEAVCHHHLKD